MNCITQKSDGSLCEAKTLTDDLYCFFHSPNVSEEERKSAQSRGGKGNTMKTTSPLPARKIDKAKDVVALLEETVNLVRAGELDVKVANCIGVLSGQVLKALEMSTIATRVEIIERAILERRINIS